MSSPNSTVPRTSNSNNNATLLRDDKDDKPESEQNKAGAATYYGAVVIVVFILIALSIVVRIVYTRKYRKRGPPIDEPDPTAREDEERMAMQRRGEDMGLPTYRESTLLPNNDTVLAATPITSTPFGRDSTAETLPHSDELVRHHTASLPMDDNAQPPKYEDELTVRPTGDQDHNPPTLDITNEMRMSTQSTATLVLPSIAIHQPGDDDDDDDDDDNPPPNQPNQRPSSPSPPFPAAESTV